MARQRSRARRRPRRPEPGTVPGTWSVDPSAPSTIVRVIAYGGDKFQEATTQNVSELDALLKQHERAWVDVVGLGNAEVLTQLQSRFKLHPLTMADIVHTYQRPKLELYDDQLFIIIRGPHNLSPRPLIEQISIVVTPSVVLTFQEDPKDCFDAVRERLRRDAGRIRALGPDYLAYALIDDAIDHHFPIVEHYADKLGQVEESMLRGESHDVLPHLLEIKRELINLRSGIGAMRDVLRLMLNEATPGITADTRLYLRDCHDHAVQLLDDVEHHREYSSSLVDIHLSMASQRLNTSMRLLTAMSTLFLPLTFIAGIYGMNFDTNASPWSMPELRWYWGYPFALALMGSLGVGLFIFLWKRGWIGR